MQPGRLDLPPIPAGPLRRAGTQPAHLRPVSTLETVIGASALLALVATSIFGTVAAAIFIAAAMLLIALRPLASMHEVLRFWPLLLLPLVAMISTLWSDAPERTLRAALQLMLTSVAAIMVCRRLEARQAILALFAGYVVLALLSLPYVPVSLAYGSALVGMFGSKNQMGFCAHLLVALALAVIVDREQPWLARLVGLAAVPTGLLLLYLSNSGGATVSIGITLLMFPALVMLGWLPPRGRLVVLLLLIVATAVGIIFLADIQAAATDFRENVLHKDATLTGRTYLWDYADQINRERPWLGGGYYAFWRHGNLDAEGLWRWGGVASRTGFNFHNAFVEIQVDLGRVGLVLLIGMCVGITLAAGYRQFTRPTIGMAFFLAFLAVSLSRAFTETNLIAPFSVVTMLTLAAAVYAVAPAAARVRKGADMGTGKAAGGHGGRRRGALPARPGRSDGRQDPDTVRAPARAYSSR